MGISVKQRHGPSSPRSDWTSWTEELPPGILGTAAMLAELHLRRGSRKGVLKCPSLPGSGHVVQGKLEKNWALAKMRFYKTIPKKVIYIYIYDI